MIAAIRTLLTLYRLQTHKTRCKLERKAPIYNCVLRVAGVRASWTFFPCRDIALPDLVERSVVYYFRFARGSPSLVHFMCLSFPKKRGPQLAGLHEIKRMSLAESPRSHQGSSVSYPANPRGLHPTLQVYTAYDDFYAHIMAVKLIELNSTPPMWNQLPLKPLTAQVGPCPKRDGVHRTGPIATAFWTRKTVNLTRLPSFLSAIAPMPPN